MPEGSSWFRPQKRRKREACAAGNDGLEIVFWAKENLSEAMHILKGGFDRFYPLLIPFDYRPRNGALDYKPDPVLVIYNENVDLLRRWSIAPGRKEVGTATNHERKNSSLSRFTEKTRTLEKQRSGVKGREKL